MTAADVAIFGANIITIDPVRPRAQALAVKFERILAVGTDDDVVPLVGANTTVIDARGKTVTPGFIDAHCHPLDAARRALMRTDCGPEHATSVADVKRALAERALSTPRGEWVCGFGYDEAKLPERRLLTREDLDEVSREHPIFVEHSSGHIAMVNSLGLQRGTLTAASADPAGGRYGRYTNGDLDGSVYETGQDLFIGRGTYRGHGLIPDATPEQDAAALAMACAEAGKLGITGWHEMLCDPTMLRAYHAGHHMGILTSRVSAYIYVDYLSEIMASGIATGFGDTMLRLGGVKMLGDGALSGRTAYLEEPYAGSGDDYGVQGIGAEEMSAKVLAAHRAGLQIGIHANGDRFIGMVLDAYEHAITASPRREHRHRVEHCSVMNPRLMARMKHLGLLAIPFGQYIYYHGEKMNSYGAKRLGMMLPHRSFLDAGVPAAGSSDYPCGPWNPMVAIQSCVTRMSRTGELIGAGQRISAEEAIRVYTIGSAYASFEERFKGSIEIGKLADLAFLESDPTAVDPDAISEILVTDTMLGGQMVFRR